MRLLFSAFILCLNGSLFLFRFVFLFLIGDALRVGYCKETVVRFYQELLVPRQHKQVLVHLFTTVGGGGVVSIFEVIVVGDYSVIAMVVVVVGDSGISVGCCCCCYCRCPCLSLK